MPTPILGGLSYFSNQYGLAFDNVARFEVRGLTKFLVGDLRVNFSRPFLPMVPS